jgi:ubiquinone/menaquinone biosynthesis C-methylase UbiE
MSVNPADEYAFYVCPTCKGPLSREPQALCCPRCSQAYPLVGTIPDFLIGTGFGQESLVRRIEAADHSQLKWLSKLYESSLWYSLVISIYLGRKSTTLADLTQKIKSEVNVEQGRVLDVACGTATFSRRVATPWLAVYGIDVSMAMLSTGAEYIQRDRLHNIHLARTPVENLPFPDHYFDFAIASGSLHLFPDTAAALKEIWRTLKPGARIVGLTFGHGDRGFVRYAWFRERLKQRGTVRLFQLDELEGYFRQAGFEWGEPERMGSGIFFKAQKQ